MSSILLLTSSPRAESLSTPIAVDLAERLKSQNPGSVVVRRDLAANPLPHIDDLFTGAIRKPAEARTAEEAAAVETSDELVNELLAADTIVISTGLSRAGGALLRFGTNFVVDNGAIGAFSGSVGLK